MSLAKMASVDYLVGYVAADDGRAHESGAALTRYYAAAGYPPGAWLGGGLAALGAADQAGTRVTEQQLRLLFEQAQHPFTGAKLGRPPVRYPTRQERIQRRVAALPDDMTAKQRAAAIGRIEADEKETKTRSAVAGFDLTFSVPKSVSALWAIAPADTQRALYDAHRSALEATLGLVEKEAVFTRTGARGARRVRITGLIGAAFDHWDSRRGDPQLHTHVVVANRVQGPDGRWRTLDSATLHRAVVAYSATYNQLLADEVTRRTGLTWTTRERTHGSNRRSGRELAVVPDALIAAFSQRSVDIETAVDTAITAQVERTGRRPSVRSINRIRQHLTLTTRDRKQHPSLATAAQQWENTAAAVLHRDPSGWAADAITAHEPRAGRLRRAGDVDDSDVDLVALRVVDTVAHARSTWTRWNLTAETMRHVAGDNLHFASADEVVAVRDRVVAAAERLSVQITAPELATVPDAFRDVDGTSQLAPLTVYTSRRVLAAEDTLLVLADDRTGPRVADHGAHALATRPLPGRTYALAGQDQAPAAVAVVTSGRVVDVLVGPAGTGKTTSLAGIRAMWEVEHGPGSVVGLAPSAIAAQVLASDLGIITDNTAQWLAQQLQQPAREKRIAALTGLRDRAARDRRDTTTVDADLAAARADYDRWRLRPGQLLIVDEAGLAGTFPLIALAEQAKAAGAKLLLVGDPHQLSPVDTGGAFTLLVSSRQDPPTLSVVRRFMNPDGTRRRWEEAAAAHLRVGDPRAAHAYQAHGRIHTGTTDQITDAAYTAWLADTRAGRSSVLIAPTTDQVRSLNERARADLAAAGVVDNQHTLVLRDALPVGRGDRIVTRRTDRTLPDGTSPDRGARWDGFVRNGQRWHADRVHRDGALTARLLDHTDTANPIPVTLPAVYVREHVELGYAVTAHRAQGLTVDTAHALGDTGTTREAFYVAMTRGRHANHAYLTLDHPAAHHHRDDVHALAGDPEPSTTGEVIAAILVNTAAEPSAHDAIRAEQDRAASVATLAAEADTIAAAAHRTATTQLLVDVLGDTPAVQKVLTADDYPHVVTAVRAVRAAGHDVPATVRTVGGRLQAGHTLTAAALAGTLNRSATTGTPTRPRLVAGLIPDATLGITDPQVLHALRERYQLIEHRADTLLDSESAADAPWLRRIPRHGSHTDRWRATARVVAAYCDRWGITGTQALGPTPDATASHAHHADHRRATNALAIHHSTQCLGSPAPVASATRATSPRNL